MKFPIEVGMAAPLDNLFSAEFSRWIRDNVKAASKTLFLSVLAGASSTGGAIDLHTFTIPPLAFSDVGNVLEFEVGGLMAANANNKQLQMLFGGTVLYDSTALAANNKPYRVRGVVFATSAAAQVSTVDGFLNAAAIAPAHLTNLAIASTANIIVKTSTVAATTANSDIIEYWARAELHQTLNDSYR